MFIALRVNTVAAPEERHVQAMNRSVDITLLRSFRNIPPATSYKHCVPTGLHRGNLNFARYSLSVELATNSSLEFFASMSGPNS